MIRTAGLQGWERLRGGRSALRLAGHIGEIAEQVGGGHHVGTSLGADGIAVSNAVSRASSSLVRVRWDRSGSATVNATASPA